MNQAKDPEALRGEGKGRVSALQSPCPAAHAEEGRRQPLRCVGSVLVIRG
jgi:hypothetical protein